MEGQKFGQLATQVLFPPGLFASVSKISKAVDAPPSSVTSTPRTPRMDFSRVTGKGRREHRGQRGCPRGEENESWGYSVGSPASVTQFLPRPKLPNFRGYSLNS